MYAHSVLFPRSHPEPAVSICITVSSFVYFLYQTRNYIVQHCNALQPGHDVVLRRQFLVLVLQISQGTREAEISIDLAMTRLPEGIVNNIRHNMVNMVITHKSKGWKLVFSMFSGFLAKLG